VLKVKTKGKMQTKTNTGEVETEKKRLQKNPVGCMDVCCTVRTKDKIPDSHDKEA
jgi:hypothetical protein